MSDSDWEAGDKFSLPAALCAMARRAPGRTAAFILALSLLSFLLSAATLVSRGMSAAAARSFDRMGADAVLLPKHGVNAFSADAPTTEGGLPEGIEKAAVSLPGVSMVAPRYVVATDAAGCCEGNYRIIGYSEAADFAVRAWQKDAGAVRLGEDRVLVGARVLKAPGAALRVYNRSLTVAGRLEKSGEAGFDSSVFVPLEGLAALEGASGKDGMPLLKISWGRPSLLLLKFESSADAASVARELERLSPEVRAEFLAEPGRGERRRLQMLAGLPSLVPFAWGAAFLAGGALNWLYWRGRAGTLALLAAFGRRSRIIGFCAAETALLSFAGAVAGSIGALLACRWCAPATADALALPLLVRSVSAAGAGLPAVSAGFAGAIAAEAVLAVALLLQREPRDLLGSS